MNRWPRTAETLEHLQRELALRAAEAVPWTPSEGHVLCAATFITHPTPAADEAALAERGPSGPGEPSWAAAALCRRARRIDGTVVGGSVVQPYRPGLLALREGPLLEEAVRGLAEMPELLMVNATGLDHPRGAGLALHLGAVLEVPSIGITDRPLRAKGEEPGPERGSATPLTLEGRIVGYRVRTVSRVRPVCVHAAWRSDPDTARMVVGDVVRRSRTPEPIRQARFLARTRRAEDEGRVPE